MVEPKNNNSGSLFHKVLLDELKPKEKRYSIFDHKIPCLNVVIHPTGLKTFYLNRKVKNQSQKIKIGRYDMLSIEQARKRAKDLNALIELGGDPQNDRKEEKEAPTFQDIYELYYEHYAVKFTKRPIENRKTVLSHVYPVFKNKKAHLISQQDVRDFYQGFGEKISKYSKGDEIKKSYGTASRVLAIVSAVYNYSIKEGLLTCPNPCVGLKKKKSYSRDRFLTYDELNAFFKALKDEEMLFADLFKVLLYTGARKGNVLTLKYSELNFDFKYWRISELQSKNKEINIISLSEPALKILIRREAFNEFRSTPSLYVFPGDGKMGHLADPKKAFERIKKAIRIYDIRIHDLRRTLGSYMAISGASLPIIGKALSHKSQVSTAIYARLSQDPVLNAVNIAADLMANNQ